ncbi:hypothetical protein JS84_25950 [Vibrio vulnificus]|nr:hypothetical protein JS84_25950 [Vibrio vulnificus]
MFQRVTLIFIHVLMMREFAANQSLYYAILQFLLFASVNLKSQWNNGTPVFMMEAVKSLNMTGHIKIVL